MLPYLPFLPTDQNDAARCGATPTDNIAFDALIEEHVCLECASPFNANCGFWNFALRRSDEPNGAWRVSTRPCMCRACDAHCEMSNGGGDGVVADRRARLVQRHNTRLLDRILGVDESVAQQRRFVKNRVPVIELRRALFYCPGEDNHLYNDNAKPAGEMGPDVPLAGYDRDSELSYIFCSFSRTVAFVSGNERGRALLRRAVLDRAAELDRRYQIAVPARLANEPERCWLLGAALLRVTVAYDLAYALSSRSYRPSSRSAAQWHWYELQLQLFADTHLDLHLNCDVFRQYTDEELQQPWYRSLAINALPRDAVIHEIVGQSLLARSYPHPLRALWAGELANATGSLAAGDIWTKVSDAGSSMVSSFIHVFLCKATNHKCMVRNFSKILCETFGEHESMLPFVINILEVHKLGNFPDARFRPRWRTRLAVRRSHHMDRFEMFSWCSWCSAGKRVPCPKPGCDNTVPRKKCSRHREHRCDVCEFFAEIEPQLYIAVKEFYVFQVRCQRIVEAVQLFYSEWAPYRDTMFETADDARRALDRIYVAGAKITPESLRKGINKLTNDVLRAQQCNKTVQRLRKDYRVYELILRSVNHAHNGMVVCKTWTGCQQPEDYLLAPVQRRGELYADKRLKRMNACFAPLEHLDGRRWCDVYTLRQVRAVAEASLELGDICVSLLATVGMSPQCVEVLREMICNSEMRNMPDNSVKKIFMDIYRQHPVDFHLLHYFLNCMQRQDMVRVVSLDFRTAAAQALALRRRYQIWPWQPLPPDVDSLFVCRGDRHIYTELVEGIDETTLSDLLGKREDGDALYLSSAPFARGVKGALYNHQTKRLYCSKDASSTVARKFKRDGLFDTPEMFGNTQQERKIANSVRVARETKRRCEAPLDRISMLGHMVRIGTRAYTLCTVCAAPCQLENSRIGPSGPTCGRHHQFAEEDCYVDLRLFANRFMQQVRECPQSTGKDAHLFPLPVQLLCAPHDVKHTSTPAEKFGCIGTPLFVEDAFKTHENIAEWDSGGAQKVPSKAALREFSLHTPPLVDEVSQIANDDNATPDTERQTAPDCELSAETLRDLSFDAVANGQLTQRVAIQCAFCYARCKRKERYVRITIIDISGALVESLSGLDTGVRGPIDIWLCGVCFKKARPFLAKNNLVFAQDLYNTLREALRRTKLRRLTFRTK